MTQEKNFKRLVRQRMRKTGESYTAARLRLRAGAPHSPVAAGGSSMYPFERFTEKAKTVLTLAQEEAESARHSYIGTEHILIGLLRQGDGVAAVVLANLRVELEPVRNQIHNVLGRNERIIVQQIIPTSRVKKVIEIAFEEAGAMGHNFVGTEHLLLGLLIEGEGIAAHVLIALGATLEKVRAEISRLLAEQGSRSSKQPAATWRTISQGRTDPPASEHVLSVLGAALTLAQADSAPEIGLDHLLRAAAESERAEALFKKVGLERSAIAGAWNRPVELVELGGRLQQEQAAEEKAAGSKDYVTAGKHQKQRTRLLAQFKKALDQWTKAA